MQKNKGKASSKESVVSKSDDKIKVTVLKREPQINGWHTNSVTFKIKNINYVILNTIKRTILQSIPIYAFDPDYMTVVDTENKNMINTACGVSFLTCLPIINKSYKKMVINNDESLLNQVLQLEKDAIDILDKELKLSYTEIEALKEKQELDKINNLHIELNFKNILDNKSQNQLNIREFTTDDAKYFINGSEIPSIYPAPITLIKLKPGEEYIATLVAKLNIAMHNSIYRACAACYYEEINESEYNFTIESMRQISEEDIAKRACKIINIKLDHLENILKSSINDEFNVKGTINIPYNNHTIGNLISRAIQEHSHTKFCGYKQNHLNINEIILDYLTDGTSIKIIINESFKNYKNIFELIYAQFDKLVE
jgi:DNA-directed RNA polymerase subunit L